MSKPKFSAEERAQIVQEYLDGKGSYRVIGEKYGIRSETVRDWTMRYKLYGIEGFATGFGNKAYTTEFKQKCVEMYLRGEGALEEICVKYDISTHTVLRRWIKKYTANKELRDYDPRREVYMAEARRKTTVEERIEIAKYCIEHGLDYKGTASVYDVSYSQVYSWVRKYKDAGEDGLVDRRGKHKTDDEVDELERLRRENRRLKRQLEERDMAVELLKKVKEFEGM
jgi:transposase-like protein